MAIEWSRHPPVYRNPDGTVWLRFLRDDLRELDQLSDRFVGHGQVFVFSPGPVYVLYDPSPKNVPHRYRQGGRSQHVQIPNSWQALAPLLIIPEDGTADVIRLLPTRSMRPVEEWERLAFFLSWAFPQETEIELWEEGRAPRTVRDLLAMQSAWKPGTLGATVRANPGQPEFDLEPYRLLGVSPLALPDDQFIEWMNAQEQRGG